MIGRQFLCCLCVGRALLPQIRWDTWRPGTHQVAWYDDLGTLADEVLGGARGTKLQFQCAPESRSIHMWLLQLHRSNTSFRYPENWITEL